MFPPLPGAFSTCVERRSRWVFWKLLEQYALQPENAPEQARELTEPVPAATRRFHYMRRTAIALGILEAA
jgi:hypothetical protein